MKPVDPQSTFLLRGRMHEACGAGAPMLALAYAARVGGNVMWVQEGWQGQQIHPHGVSDFLDPARLTLSLTQGPLETLAVAEEALRSGAVSLVVLTPSKPIGLTEGRRLQLAARDGAATGLALIADGAGSNATETRWRATPIFDAEGGRGDSTLQRWDLIKNKSGTLGVWHVRWDTASRRLSVVSPAGK
ncbi:ImuA family protein [Thalassovita mediterranea]|nr:hypothetical protein [Thalassovita mediterranea]